MDRREFIGGVFAAGAALWLAGCSAEGPSQKSPEEILADRLNPNFDPERRYGEGAELKYEYQSPYGFNLRVFSDKDNFVQDGTTLEEILMSGIHHKDEIVKKLEESDVVKNDPIYKDFSTNIGRLIDLARDRIDNGLFEGITINLFVPSKPDQCVKPPENTEEYVEIFESKNRGDCSAIGATVRPQLVDGTTRASVFIDTIEMTIASGFFGDSATQSLRPFGENIEYTYQQTMTSTLAHEGVHLWLRVLTASDPNLSPVEVNEVLAQAIEYGLSGLVGDGTIPSVLR
jgi:hypothetical protein